MLVNLLTFLRNLNFMLLSHMLDQGPFFIKAFLAVVDLADVLKAVKMSSNMAFEGFFRKSVVVAEFAKVA